MKIQEIKFKNLTNKYSLFIGKNILNLLNKKVKLLCPRTKNIAIIIDHNVPKKFKKILRKNLKNYKIFFLDFKASEKNKSLDVAKVYLNKLLSQNLSRSDLIIAVGGGIVGDVVGFIASAYKRGINFINIPTSLLAQVDSSIGGKTGVNSKYGKNLIGSFYQPLLVLIDISFLKTLPNKEMVCGYAEILKHSIIRDKLFFKWLKKNTNSILQKKEDALIFAIKKSCQIKMSFVRKDVNENNLRMILNFGHTFAHAIEAKSNYSSKITHGEAVLTGMILATRLSYVKKVCSINVVKDIEEVYFNNNLSYTYEKYLNYNSINGLIPFLKSDKKNFDNKINFILLRSIGKTAQPNANKISISNLKKSIKQIIQF